MPRKKTGFLEGKDGVLASGRNIYSVSQVTQDIKSILEAAFPGVWIEGEISNFRPASSGHFYFSLKDETAVLGAAMFSWANKGVSFKLEDGLKVICFGRIDVYPPRGQYQLIVERVEPKGVGSLQLALEQLKKKLEKEGLFAAAHKRLVPYLPSKIGIVTSPSGAAIKDILKVLDNRFADVHIIVSPAQVQGEGAKEEVASAIKELNALNEVLPAKERIEVMIVGRGGGSIEDLWAFNEEVVARAIYNSKIPVISAVGHERDWTIADLVADLRAPTPSAAAEMVVPKKEDLRERLKDLSGELSKALLDTALILQETVDDLSHRLNLGMGNSVKLNIQRSEAVAKKLFLLNPAIIIEQNKERLKDLARQTRVRLEHLLKLKETCFLGVAAKLSTLSPLNILGRGYSITFKFPENTVINEAGVLKKGDSMISRFHRGEVISEVTEVR
jgi:exodeoxyribonuclease VII large subunit